MSQMTSWSGHRSGIRAVRHPAQALGFIARVLATMRQRRQLAELPDHLLEDIGVTPAEARREALRPFWNMPATTFNYR